MGTDTHKPASWKAHDPFHTGHAHEDEFHAAGPGVRPGTRSRIMEARERLKHRGGA
jgi:hypothetical protein